MDAVVVGDVADVVVAQGDEEREQRLFRDLEGVAEVAVLEEGNTTLEQRFPVPSQTAEHHRDGTETSFKTIKCNLKEREPQDSERAAGRHHFGELEDVETPVVGTLEQLKQIPMEQVSLY